MIFGKNDAPPSANRRAAVVLLFLLLGCVTGLGDGILFGPEFTFTRFSLYFGSQRDSDATHERRLLYRRKMLAEIQRRCPDCRVNMGSGRVVFPDLFSLTIKSDLAVLEVVMKAGTVADYEARREQFQSLIFDAAESVGLTPHRGYGAGHINIDIETAFRGDAKLFRDFIVDSANHPELFRGILGDSGKNARVISELPSEAQIEFARVIKEFDEGKIKTIQELSQAIRKRVYRDGKSFAVGLYHEGRIEMRGVDAQTNIDDFIKEIRLFEQRIEYLRARKSRVALEMPKDLTWREKRGRFKDYLKDCQLEWNDYRHLPDPFYRRPLRELPPCSWLSRLWRRARPR